MRQRGLADRKGYDVFQIIVQPNLNAVYADRIGRIQREIHSERPFQSR